MSATLLAPRFSHETAANRGRNGDEVLVAFLVINRENGQVDTAVLVFNRGKVVNAVVSVALVGVSFFTLALWSKPAMAVPMPDVLSVSLVH